MPRGGQVDFADAALGVERDKADRREIVLVRQIGARFLAGVCSVRVSSRFFASSRALRRLGARARLAAALSCGRVGDGEHDHGFAVRRRATRRALSSIVFLPIFGKVCRP